MMYQQQLTKANKWQHEHDTIELCEIEIGMYCDDECEDDCDEHLVSPRPIYAFIWKGDYQ